MKMEIVIVGKSALICSKFTCNCYFRKRESSQVGGTGITGDIQAKSLISDLRLRKLTNKYNLKNRHEHKLRDTALCYLDKLFSKSMCLGVRHITGSPCVSLVLREAQLFFPRQRNRTQLSTTKGWCPHRIQPVVVESSKFEIHYFSS